MAHGTISLAGLMHADNTILDALQLPTAMTTDEKEEIKYNLLAETQELEILYPDPESMKHAILYWSKKELDVWTKLYETTKYEYDPIYNYDRTEEESVTTSGTNQASGQDSRTGSGSDSSTTQNSGSDSTAHGHVITNSGTDSTTHSGTDTTLHTGTDTTLRTGTDNVTHSGTGNIMHSVQAYDDQVLQSQSADAETRNFSDNTTKNLSDAETRNLSDAETLNLTDETTHGLKETHSGTDSVTYGGKTTNTGTRSDSDSVTYGRKDTRNEKITRSVRAYGNIGVTTTMQMISEQRNIVKFCLSDIIISDFIRRFCILVW